MSIINQMLKDLEEQNLNRNQNTIDFAGINATNNVLNFARQYLFYIVCILACTLGVVISYLYLKDHLAHRPNAQATNYSAKAMPITVKPIHQTKSTVATDSISIGANNTATTNMIPDSSSITAAPIQLQDVYVTTEGTRTEIHFGLKQQTPYQLSNNDLPDHILLTLNNTVGSEQLLPYQWKLTAIAALNMVNLNDDTIVDITMKPGTIIQGLSYAQYNPNELVLVLNNDSQSTTSGVPLSNPDLNSSSSSGSGGSSPTPNPSSTPNPTPDANSAQSSSSGQTSDTKKTPDLLDNLGSQDIPTAPMSPLHQLAPINQKPYTPITVVKFPIAMSPQDRAARDYQAALTMVDQYQINNAILQLQKILANMPNYISARKTLVILYLKQGQINIAQRILAQGLRQLPYYPAYILLQARIYVAQGNFKKALITLQNSSPEMSANTDYYALMAGLYQRLQQPRLAIQLYQQLVQVNPTNSLWWMGLGISYDALGKSNSALVAYEKASSLGSLKPPLQAYIYSRMQFLSGTQ